MAPKIMPPPLPPLMRYDARGRAHAVRKRSDTPPGPDLFSADGQDDTGDTAPRQPDEGSSDEQ